MHHLHISTGALVVGVIFLLVITALVLSFVESIKRDRRNADLEMERIKRGASVPGAGRVYVGGSNGAAGAPASSSAFGAAPVYAAAPVTTGYVAPGYGAGDVALGMVAGAALGASLSHHDTVIVERGGYAPDVYTAPIDTGIDISDGPAFGGDIGGGGGIDISFGGGD